MWRIPFPFRPPPDLRARLLAATSGAAATSGGPQWPVRGVALGGVLGLAAPRGPLPQAGAAALGAATSLDELAAQANNQEQAEPALRSLFPNLKDE